MNGQTITQQTHVAPARWEATVRSWPDGEARDWARDLMQAANHNGTVNAVVVTGSAVRDVDRSDDLDLVLVYSAVRPSLPKPPISVDLRCYDQADVAARLAAGHSYLSWAVRFGRALFERDRWWSRLRAEWNDHLLLPSASEAIERAQRAERQRDGLAAAGDDDAAAELQLAALTHRARAALTRSGVFPQSRPELAAQLRRIGEDALAERLSEALVRRSLLS